MPDKQHPKEELETTLSSCKSLLEALHASLKVNEYRARRLPRNLAFLQAIKEMEQGLACVLEQAEQTGPAHLAQVA